MTEQDGILTEGRALLVAWMAEDPKGRSQGFISRQLDVSQPAVRSWVKGLSRPESPFRDALEMLCGIPATTWELQSERDKRTEAMRRIRETEANAAAAANESGEPSDSPPASTPTPGSGEHAAVDPPSGTGTDGMGG